MHRQAARIWCLTALLLAGCEAKLQIESKPAQRQAVTISGDFVEMRSGTVTSRVKVLSAAPAVTLSITEDSSDNTLYIARTEHNCKDRTSTLRYMAVFDDKHELVIESADEVELDIDPDSLGEAELKLACPELSQAEGTLNV